jgi:SAM-dependent methyltransferase
LALWRDKIARCRSPAADRRPFPRVHLSNTPSPALRPGNDALVEAYNDVPYTSVPDAARHPDRLATIGTLLGLDVAPLATCRVLEFACGNGSNLVPIAATLPNASFVGFDFAALPVSRAQSMARDLRLTNIRLLQLDLRDLPEELGSFDYVIAHGLYSWVPTEVRAHVMPLIARHLAPNGVAFVSYNTLPGCHMRRVVWEMLKYHTRDIADKPAKVAAARGLLDLVATPVSDDDASERAMRTEVRNAATGSDSALAHDDLSEPNNPVYFHEFIADAARAGLTFLAEAHLHTMMGGGLAPQVREALGRLDRLAREQYLDFIHFRHFRESLLCHANALSRFVVQPPRVLGLHALPSLNVRRAAASSPPVPEPDADFGAVKQLLLARWPRAVPVAELDRWRAQNASATAAGNAPRSTELLVAELYVAGSVELRSAPVAVAAVPGEHPEAFAAARWINREHEVIPSLYHEALRYQDPLGRRLLALLDGTKNREELMAALGGPFAGPAGRAHLDDALKILASKALLVG